MSGELQTLVERAEAAVVSFVEQAQREVDAFSEGFEFGRRVGFGEGFARAEAQRAADALAVRHVRAGIGDCTPYAELQRRRREEPGDLALQWRERHGGREFEGREPVDSL